MKVASGPIEPLAARDVGETDDGAEREHRRRDQREQRAGLDPVANPPERVGGRGRIGHERTLATAENCRMKLRSPA